MSGFVAVLAQTGYQTYESSDPPGWFFGGFLILWGVMAVISVAGYVFGIWALVEIIRYRDDEFAAVGLNRTTWLVLQIVGLVACQPMGAVVGILFLWKHRPTLRRWREAHPPPPPWAVPYGYGPYPGYGPPPGYPQPPGYPPPPGYPQQPGYPQPPSYGPPPAPPPPPPAAPESPEAPEPPVPPVDPWGGATGSGGPADGGR